MKVKQVSFILIIMLCSLMLCGCSEEEQEAAALAAAEASQSALAQAQETAPEAEKISPQIDVTVEKPEPVPQTADQLPEALTEEENAGESPEAEASGNETAENADQALTQETGQAPEAVTGEAEQAQAEPQKQASRVIWLGDSLTQGSLGDRDDNLANAPYVRLGRLLAASGNAVEGYGYYGYNTHDILWKYGETLGGAPKDSDAVYIFWCGSNDWVDEHIANTETGGVIAEIDAFLANNGNPISKYIVIGTTARLQLREGALYEVINASLAGHYGAHYMDVNSFISQDIENGGYVIDQVHLKQESYDKVADAVYAKLKALGYV